MIKYFWFCLFNIFMLASLAPLPLIPPPRPVFLHFLVRVWQKKNIYIYIYIKYLRPRLNSISERPFNSSASFTCNRQLPDCYCYRCWLLVAGSCSCSCSYSCSCLSFYIKTTLLPASCWTRIASHQRRTKALHIVTLSVCLFSMPTVACLNLLMALVMVNAYL